MILLCYNSLANVLLYDLHTVDVALLNELATVGKLQDDLAAKIEK